MCRRVSLLPRRSPTVLLAALLILTACGGDPGPTGSGDGDAPTLSIITPSDGAVVSTGEIIPFNAVAVDPEDGDLSPSIMWSSSRDGALGSGPAVATALSAGEHLVTARVTDSDGNSATASVSITVEADEPPTVSIESPADGADLSSGTGVTLRGSAEDAEDGDLSASLEWTSDVDGELGTGASLTVSISTGPHVIQASVTDSRGQSTTATVAVTVRPGGTWRTLEDGTDATVRTILVGPSAVYVGGEFDIAGGLVVNGITEWDGSDWNRLATGVDFDVYAVARGGAPDELYLRGLGQLNQPRLARWNGTSFASLPLPDGLEDVFGMTGDGDGNLYLAGASRDDGADVFRFDGTSWEPVGDDVGFLNLLATGPDGELYGATTSSFGSEVFQLVGSAWTSIGTANQAIFGLHVDEEGNLYAGGDFTTLSLAVASGIAVWDGTTWSGIGEGVLQGGSGRVEAIATGPDGHVYAGGLFGLSEGSGLQNLAMWDGDGWSRVGGGVVGWVRTLAVDGEGHLYVGGTLGTLDPDGAEIPVNHIAVWEGN